jgi:lysophospholipase L1-like esterase
LQRYDINLNIGQEGRRASDLWAVRVVLVGSPLCTAVLCALLTFSQSRVWLWGLVGAVAVAFCMWLVAARLAGRAHWLGWLLALAVVNFLIVVPELLLRALDFRYESGIQYGRELGEGFVRFVPDEKLFWKLSPSEPGVNSMGFWGDEIAIPKSDRVYRILYLGDSCTQQGYPDIVEIALNHDPPDHTKQYECVTLAISGYSSYQGVVLAEEYAGLMEADLAVVYYGWNDHWLAYGAIDTKRVVEVPDNRVEEYVSSAFHYSRLLQAVRKCWHAVWRNEAEKPLDEVRVSPVQYWKNLNKIYDAFEVERVPVVFVTAPTSHYSAGVPDMLVAKRFVPDKDFAVRMHRRYNRIVREVAAEKGAYLLDLEYELGRLGDSRRVFGEDGIHFTKFGVTLVGQIVSEFLRKEVL